jgi:uncharacterized membrane protein
MSTNIVQQPNVAGDDRIAADRDRTAGVNGHSNYDHDESTVHSPTQEHFSEKRRDVGPGGEAGAGTDAGVGTGKASGFEKFATNKFVTWGLRALQAIFAITTLGLAATSLNKFFLGEQRMRYTVFCASFTLLYLLGLFLVSFLAPSYLLGGALLIVEIMLTIFWLAAFIAVAARYSGFSCTFPVPGQIAQISNTGCRSGKAVAAFAAISFLLFLLSSLLLLYNVFRKSRSGRNRDYLFKPVENSKEGYLDKTGLALNPNFNAGVDNVNAGYDQSGTGYNASTGQYNTNTGQYNANAGEYNASTGIGVTGDNRTGTTDAADVSNPYYNSGRQTAVGVGGNNIERPTDAYTKTNPV